MCKLCMSFYGISNNFDNSLQEFQVRCQPARYCGSFERRLCVNHLLWSLPESCQCNCLITAVLKTCIVAPLNISQIVFWRLPAAIASCLHPQSNCIKNKLRAISLPFARAGAQERPRPIAPYGRVIFHGISQHTSNTGSVMVQIFL